MSTRYVYAKDSSSRDPIANVPFATNSPPREDLGAIGIRNRSLQNPLPPASPPFLLRTAMRVSRSRWFAFMRRVFHYQNGSNRSDLGSNPFNSSTWMMLEFMALVVQISVSTFTMSISESEKPVWPMRVWIVGYDIGCALSLLLLYGRCRRLYGGQEDVFVPSDMEQQRDTEESRYSHLMNKCRTSLELFFAIWFVMGNVWVFESRFESFRRAPKLHVICISLLTWNALCYSFPFMLFLLLCFFVPLISSLLGYNMNKGSIDRGASDDQISALPSWRFKEIGADLERGNDDGCTLTLTSKDHECCICLAKYKEKEEIRQLPCSHMFHLKCVDQWLRIISCCPLCKQGLDR